MSNLSKELIESDVRRDLERRFSESGADLKSLFEADSRAVSLFEFKRDCLDPYEVELACLGELRDDRLKHTDQCSSCFALLALAQPTDTIVERLIARSRAAIRSRAPGKEAASSWLPVRQAALIELCLLMSGALVIACFNQYDFVFSTALYEATPSLLIFIGLVVLVTLCPLAAATKSRFAKRNLIVLRYGGLVVGCCAVLITAVSFAINVPHMQAEYKRLNLSFAKLLQANVLRSYAERGLEPWAVGTTFITSEDFGGRFLVRTTSTESADLSFEPSSFRRVGKRLGTICKGSVENLDGGQVVATSNNDKRPLIVDDALRQGDQIVAYMSDNTSPVTTVREVTLYDAPH
jgi:hypothetical protein